MGWFLNLEWKKDSINEDSSQLTIPDGAIDFVVTDSPCFDFIHRVNQTINGETEVGFAMNDMY
ncbi:hypothetical protein D7X87_13920 [bacterium D16-54]|nr:hypothetical protein D7X87_13920 [bacterium D16-54]RKJ14872.1 hypothetical protein D7X65_09355 [bacterium D16-56]